MSWPTSPRFSSQSTQHQQQQQLLLLLLLLHPFNGLFSGTTWVSRYRKGKTSLDLNEATTVASAGPHTNNLHLAPDRLPRQQLITQSLNFYRPDAFPDVQPTVSKHRRYPIDTNTAYFRDAVSSQPFMWYLLTFGLARLLLCRAIWLC